MERSPSTGEDASWTTYNFEFQCKRMLSVSLTNCRIVLGAKQPTGYLVIKIFDMDKAVET